MLDQFTSVAEIGGYLTILGLITWLVRRVFTHTIPRLAADYKESLEKQQVLFQNALKDLQVTFQNALSDQRVDFKESLKDERTDFRTALRDEREQSGKQLDRLVLAVDRLAQTQVVTRDGN